MPNQRLLSDDEVALRAHLDGGGALLLTGEPGRFDQYHRERPVDALADLYEHDRVTWLADGPERSPEGPEGRVGPLYPYLPEAHDEVARAVRLALPRGLPVRVDAGRFIGVGAYRTAEGRVAAHLLNYANARRAETIGVSLAPWLPQGDVDLSHAGRRGELEPAARASRWSGWAHTQRCCSEAAPQSSMCASVSSCRVRSTLRTTTSSGTECGGREVEDTNACRDQGVGHIWAATRGTAIIATLTLVSPITSAGAPSA